MDACVKSIAIGKKDAVINKWRLEVIKDGDRKLSFLIKQALLSYLKDEKFIEIGKIHFNPSIDIPTEKEHINLWLDDSPELAEWADQLQKEGLKVTKVFKEIILRSITIVSDNEEEFIPSYYDFIGNTKGILDTLKTALNKQEKQTSPSVKKEKINTEPQSMKPNSELHLHNANEETKRKDKTKSNKDNNIIVQWGLGVKH